MKGPLTKRNLKDEKHGTLEELQKVVSLGEFCGNLEGGGTRGDIGWDPARGTAEGKTFNTE